MLDISCALPICIWVIFFSSLCFRHQFCTHAVWQYIILLHCMPLLPVFVRLGFMEGLMPCMATFDKWNRCPRVNILLPQWATERTISWVDNSEAYFKEYRRSTWQDPSLVAHNGISSTQECLLAWLSLLLSFHFPQSQAKTNYLCSSFYSGSLGPVEWRKSRIKKSH